MPDGRSPTYLHSFLQLDLAFWRLRIAVRSNKGDGEVPDWFGAFLVMGITVIAGLWFNHPLRHQEPTSGPLKLDSKSNIQQWQWIGAGVGFLGADASDWALAGG